MAERRTFESQKRQGGEQASQNAMGISGRGGVKYKDMSLQDAQRALVDREITLHYESDGDDESQDFYGIIAEVYTDGNGKLRANLMGSENGMTKSPSFSVGLFDQGYTREPGSSVKRIIKIGDKVDGGWMKSLYNAKKRAKNGR